MLGIRLNGRYIDVGAIWRVIRSLGPLFRKWQIFFSGSGGLGSSLYPPSWVTVLCLLRCLGSSCPEIPTSPVLQDFVRSFKVEVPVRSVRPPAWDLEVVLRYLRSSAFEPLSGLSLRSLTKKVLFLIALATAKRVSEL